jgi:hypothetical protein
MADAATTIRLHESDYIYTPALVPETGTLTLTGATVTLYDSAGNIAGGVDAAAAVVTSGANAGPQAWYKLEPSVIEIVPGSYSLAYLTTDSAGIKREVVVLVVVLADYD